jgi:hypothetical protein
LGRSAGHAKKPEEPPTNEHPKNDKHRKYEAKIPAVGYQAIGNRRDQSGTNGIDTMARIRPKNGKQAGKENQEKKPIQPPPEQPIMGQGNISEAVEETNGVGNPRYRGLAGKLFLRLKSFQGISGLEVHDGEVKRVTQERRQTDPVFPKRGLLAPEFPHHERKDENADGAHHGKEKCREGGGLVMRVVQAE